MLSKLEANRIIYKMCLEIIYLIYKKDLVVNNLQCLICHKTKPNQINQT